VFAAFAVTDDVDKDGIYKALKSIMLSEYCWSTKTACYPL